MDRVIDLTDKTALVTFAKLISKFKVPQSILDSAARLNIPLPTLIKSPGPLLKSLLIDNWRKEPAQFDIPANGQIFGHLVYLAGIDSIVYPSSKTGERYLPEAAIKSLSPAEYAATTKAKRAGKAQGKQFVAQPKKIAAKTANYR